jgi:hypothetical protein
VLGEANSPQNQPLRPARNYPEFGVLDPSKVGGRAIEYGGAARLELLKRKPALPFAPPAPRLVAQLCSPARDSATAYLETNMQVKN